MSLLSLPTTSVLLVAELALLAFGRSRVSAVDAAAGRVVVRANGFALLALALAALVDGLVLGVGAWTGELFGGSDGLGLVVMLLVTGAVPPLAHGLALAGTAYGVVLLARRVREEGRGDREADGQVSLP